MSQPSSPPPTDGRVLTWLNAIRGLTFTNLLVLLGLAIITVPVYVIYKALSDDKLLDRLMSTYEEKSSQMTGCTIRHVQERGGPDMWSVSSGFAFQGTDRWFVSVVLTHEPGNDEVVTYCESLKLITDQMLDRDGGANPAPTIGH